jgi:uncharacterized protein
MDWSNDAKRLLDDIVNSVIPQVFRKEAKEDVSKEAEKIAEQRNASSVDTRDVVEAFLKRTPRVFRSIIMNKLKERGFEIKGEIATEGGV